MKYKAIDIILTHWHISLKVSCSPLNFLIVRILLSMEREASRCNKAQITDPCSCPRCLTDETALLLEQQ